MSHGTCVQSCQRAAGGQLLGAAQSRGGESEVPLWGRGHPDHPSPVALISPQHRVPSTSQPEIRKGRSREPKVRASTETRAPAPAPRPSSREAALGSIPEGEWAPDARPAPPPLSSSSSALPFSRPVFLPFLFLPPLLWCRVFCLFPRRPPSLPPSVDNHFSDRQRIAWLAPLLKSVFSAGQ